LQKGPSFAGNGQSIAGNARLAALSGNLFGATNSFRDPCSDRQTTAGPFDQGFFFDSGAAPHGGDPLICAERTEVRLARRGAAATHGRV
jgi:hypothetical protein